ncbi:hypothetical protein M2451_002679 [Dysgonomonas sp. PFB1-18]|uniref:hypothetical protein n=1 Tax=unclassified Dysgonomonas TaxID=2630389 RepID=UPI002473BBCD|nr:MULTISPECIES: hypothetical protein [unclassified Dysgonomonas]MDH6309435.1 hypothetical protein [Dysgonomonas sp. PF1-14]MDH6339700.1 hypothetical protein [Dysgonomonas sp. PF1-16]MDH6381348.1 hypothetical protein [Dysgonomonas sp. PFB1-18]MDH6398563.1 hypothetical protein [Dysgonomonas sp. PF1-23]
MELHFHNDEYITPPGTLTQNLSHPFLEAGNGIELSLFYDHRYAFFFWNKWTRRILTKEPKSNPPCLVSVDWHQDLAWPTKGQKKWLDVLDISSNKDVSLYAWANLSHINDEQIVAAAYLNLIGNIYVHCRQGSDHRWEDQSYIDKYGNEHIIKRFKDYDELENYLLKSSESKVYFDIDLDYFTINNPLNAVGKNFSYMPKKEIIEMLKIERPLISWIFQRLQGFTIAIEPEHTGGLLKANKILEIIDRLYFKPSLFSNYAWQWEKHTNWKHSKG